MKLSDREKEILFAFAKNNMNFAKTGQALYMSPQNVRYYIEKVKARTGLDATNFFELNELLEGHEWHCPTCGAVWVGVRHE